MVEATGSRPVIRSQGALGQRQSHQVQTLGDLGSNPRGATAGDCSPRRSTGSKEDWEEGY
jgi:hypothetical protein